MILRWRTSLLRQFPGRSSANVVAQAMPAGANPLVCLRAFNPALQFKFCSMHVVNLGCLQVHSGSVVQLLLVHSYWSPQINILLRAIFGICNLTLFHIYMYSQLRGGRARRWRCGRRLHLAMHMHTNMHMCNTQMYTL